MTKKLALMVTMFVAVVFCVPTTAQIPAPPPAASVPPPTVLAAPGPTPAAPPAISIVPPAPLAAAPATPSAAPTAAPLPGPAPIPAGPTPAAAPEQAKPQKTPKPPRAAEAPGAPEAAPAPQPAEPPRTPESPVRERVEADPVNVRFEVTVSSQTGNGAAVKRSALVTVSNGGVAGPGPTGSGMLRSGNQVPVPTTAVTTKGEDGKETPGARPVTSYNYRSVGLNVDVNGVYVLPGNRVRASLNIEFSGMDEKVSATTGAPSFPTFSQRMSLYLDNGKPVIVAQSSDFVDNVERKQTVEVKATILR